MNTTKLFKINLILLSIILAIFSVVLLVPNTAHAADCEDQSYGGGEPCIINKSFDIEKKVRFEDDNTDKDKLIVKYEDIDEEIVFIITVKNETDDGGVDDVSFDNMRMHDYLPDGLKLISGDLTEDWDDFEPGDEKEFKIKVKIDEDYVEDDKYICVVNEAVVEYDDNEEASDTATVCFEGSEGDVLGISELPDTGASSTVALTLLGVSMITGGTALKRKSK